MDYFRMKNVRHLFLIAYCISLASRKKINDINDILDIINDDSNQIEY